MSDCRLAGRDAGRHRDYTDLELNLTDGKLKRKEYEKAYKTAPHVKVKLPKRSGKDDYDTDAALEGRNFVPERY